MVKMTSLFLLDLSIWVSWSLAYEEARLLLWAFRTEDLSWPSLSSTSLKISFESSLGKMRHSWVDFWGYRQCSVFPIDTAQQFYLRRWHCCYGTVTEATTLTPLLRPQARTSSQEISVRKALLNWTFAFHVSMGCAAVWQVFCRICT